MYMPLRDGELNNNRREARCAPLFFCGGALAPVMAAAARLFGVVVVTATLIAAAASDERSVTKMASKQAANWDVASTIAYRWHQRGALGQPYRASTRGGA